MAKKEGYIHEIDLYKTFKSDFYSYGMEVIESRALPDIRDGLKPVHRAIIYELLNSGVTSDKKFTKVAKITGAVIGNWHPHGDMAVEEALAGLTVPWKNSLPPIDIAGNQGSVFGDPAAAARYIEAKLSPAGDAYGKKLKEGIVPYVSNFDDTAKMPKVLPAQLPYLLINGISDGIAVGLATSLPPHNPKEVIDMTIAYLKNPKIKLEKLLKIMPGPDFPTAGTIINKDDLYSMYETGYGKVTARARLEYDKKEHAIQVKEIPFLFSGSMNNLVSELVRATSESGTGRSKKPPKIKGVKRIDDFSGKFGIDISIHLAKSVDEKRMMQVLLANTRLETTIKFNLRALNDKVADIYSLRQYLAEYTDFQHEIVAQEHKIEEVDLMRKIEILTGKLLASKLLDEIVDVVKHSSGKKEIMDVLMNGTILKGTNKKFHKKVKNFQFSKVQADSIASIPLYQLNKLDQANLSDERDKLMERLDIVDMIITNRDERHKLIIKRLQKEKRHLPESPRKTKIINDEPSRASDIKVPLASMYISMDKYGYIKIEDNNFKGATKTDNKSRIGFFDSEGNCWNLYMDQTKPISGRGTLSDQIFDTNKGERIVGFINPISEDSEEEILFIYKDGRLKRTEVSRFMTKTRSTKVNTRDEDHELYAVYKIPKDSTQLVINGKKYLLSNIPLQTNAAQGKLIVEPIKETDEDLSVEFVKGKVKEVETIKEQEDIFDAVVIFDGSDTCTFDWSTTDTDMHEGMYVTTYQELLKETLVFVHTDGTAKRVKGSQFKVKTRRTELKADKNDLESIYIAKATDQTLIGKYEGDYYKRIDEKEISEQSKVGGGVRVFYSTKYKLEEVMVGKGSKLEVVNFATQPKQIKE